MKYSFIKSISILILFATLGFGIYSNTLEAPFYLDDIHDIVENSHIRITNLTFNAIKSAGLNNYSSSRHIAYISFAINYYFHQYKLAGYHVVNIIIHILTTLLLYLLIKTTLKLPLLSPKYDHPDAIALFAALIWLVHPLHTQSVTYIVQRMNSMAAMFYVLSLLLYIKGRIAPENAKRWSWYTGSLMAWIMALGSKEIAATLPFFILLYEWYFFQDLDRDWFKRHLKYVFGVVMLFSLIALIYLGTNPFEKLKSLNDYAHHEFTLAERVLTQFRVVIYYLSLLAYPHPSRLNLDYDFPLSHSLIDPVTTLLSLGIVIGFIGLAVYTARRERLISFCILWFFGNLLIESSVIPLAIIFEHRTYLPSMLVWLLAVTLGYRYIKYKWSGVALVLVAAIVFSFWTYQRNSVWKDPVALWSDCAEKSPEKARPHNNLGVFLAKQDRIVEAIKQHSVALQIDYSSADAHNNLGILLTKQGKTTEAIQHYSEALRINPDFAVAHHNLGILLATQGKTTEAIQHYSEALRINPDFAAAHHKLGIALEEQDKKAKAIQHYSEALRIDPDYVEAHHNLGNALIAEKGPTDQAIGHFMKALQIKPDYVDAYNSLATALMQMGKIDEALVYLQKALQIEPDSADTHINLGIALMNNAKINTAIDHFRQALQIKPSIPEAHVNLGTALINTGKIDEALAHYREALRLEPGHAEAQNNLKRAEAILKELNAAIADIKASLKLYPRDPGLHYNLGTLYQRKGKLDAAIYAYRQALSIEPEFVEALNNLALTYMLKNENDKALALFTKLTALQPDNAGHYYNLACIYSRQNQIEKSIDGLKKAIERGYDNWDLIKTDKDLENIRGSADFKALIKDK